LHNILLLISILLPTAFIVTLYAVPGLKEHWAAFTAASAGVVYFAAKLIRNWINSISINFIGDAGRYFTPAPGNIINRQQIRREGLELLQKLHNEHLGDDAKTPRYNRIIIVGHSLGSVIAYDLLGLLWSKYHSTITKADEIQQAKLNEMQDLVVELSKIPEGNPIPDIELTKYKQLQSELLHASTAAGLPWKISDLITMGSPLSHAQLLMAKGKQALNQMQKERQYPTSPPALEAQKVINYWQTFNFETGKEIKLKVPHHAALFAFTQWTNLWFKNDFVGGPMQQSFGKCITDINLISKTNPKTPFMSHTHYWNKRETESVKIIHDIIFNK
jgi:hypothetical protein